MSGASLPVHLLAGRVWRLTWPFLWILISHHLGRVERSASMDEEEYQQLLIEFTDLGGNPLDIFDTIPSLWSC